MPAKLCPAWLECPAQGKLLPSSRGHKDADTHKRAPQGYSHMVSQSWPSVHIVCVPDWLQSLFSEPCSDTALQGAGFHRITAKLEIWQEQKSRGLGEGSASLSPIACSHHFIRSPSPSSEAVILKLLLPSFLRLLSLPPPLCQED